VGFAAPAQPRRSGRTAAGGQVRKSGSSAVLTHRSGKIVARSASGATSGMRGGPVESPSFDANGRTVVGWHSRRTGPSPARSQTSRPPPRTCSPSPARRGVETGPGLSRSICKCFGRRRAPPNDAVPRQSPFRGGGHPSCRPPYRAERRTSRKPVLLCSARQLAQNRHQLRPPRNGMIRAQSSHTRDALTTLESALEALGRGSAGTYMGGAPRPGGLRL